MDPEPIKIGEIRHKMTNLYVVGHVINKHSVPHPWKKHAVAFVSDGTGRIRFNLWRGQVDQVEVGDTVQMHSGFTRRDRGALSINTWEENILRINTNKNESKKTKLVKTTKVAGRKKSRTRTRTM